jgi:hypothetical protein
VKPQLLTGTALSRPVINGGFGDAEFFTTYPDRRSRIRKPWLDQFGACENEAEFRSLGPHDYDRRRIIVWRAHSMPGARLSDKLLIIPFLLFSDEAVSDTDATLLPIIDEIMQNAAEDYGMMPKRR